MPTLSEILRDPNYINANEATKRAIFERHAPLDQNYTGANEATQFAIRQRFGVEGFGAPVASPPPEKQSAFRQIADVPLGIAKGAVQGVRMIADAFGAGSDTSKTIKSAETYLADLMSAQAKNDQQEIARIMKDAEDKGVLDQVKAGIKAFTVAPIDTLSSALGTAAPVIAGALGAKVLGAGALLTTGVSALTGAGMGAGTIKGSIYEETKNALKEAGASEQDAEARAKLAQEYGGKNLDQILLGTVLGGAAAVGPLEKGGAAILARRILGKTGAESTETVAGQAAKGAVRRRLEAGALEAVPEAIQAGQEQVATNIALQREGFDVPTFRGAVSSATLEGLAGAGLGATVGGGKPAVAPEVPPAVPPVSPPPAAEVPPVTPESEAPPVAEVPAAPTSVTPEFLTELGIKPTAAVAKRIKGKSFDDPAVATELETYANKYATEESKPKILEFVQSLKPPVEAPVETPVTPVAETPVTPTVETPVAAAPPVQPAVTTTAPSAPETPPPMATPEGTKFTFETAKGSQYFVFEDGTTQRNKAPRPEHPSDQGVKERTARTIYVDGDASRLSAAGVTGMEGARVIIDDDGTASLVWKNPQTGALGSSAVSSKIKFYTEPAVGRSPLELWSRTEVAGREGYSGMHAGNKIVKLAPIETKAPAVETKPSVAAPATPAPAAPKAEAPAAPAVKAAAPKAEAPAAPEIAPLQEAYNKAKSALDAIGPEPAKPSPENRYFGSKGREGAAPELVRAYDEKVKAYNSWRRKYSKLKKEEVEASNVLFRAKQAQERKSLGGERAQVQAFEQTLRNLLNKFGLKDVGLKILDGMTDSGSYAAQIIRIAADAANPVRTLRHEAIHALRELGFFTDAQWKSLSKMAKDKWIDQYLKQRNVDGKPLKAGEESRYDAYMREYNGDMEKITEEAVSDAFADFDATKPPAGMLQALLKRMKDLFQSIKSALTKVESPEQIFGKVEKGELKEGAREAKGEAKSLRDRATANFRRWFGDSKVVDEKGEPLVMYHGTGADIDAFRGRGRFYFAEKPEYAASFAGKYLDEYRRPNIMPVYLSVQNPLDLTSLGGEFVSTDDIVSALKSAGANKTAQAVKDRQFEKYGRKQGVNVWELWHESPIREAVKDDGFDGVIQIEQAAKDESSMHESRVVMVFNPTQIKSAIGNNGDYSLTNADIRKSIGGRNPGEQAISIVNQMKMGIPPAKPTFGQQTIAILKGEQQLPTLDLKTAKEVAMKFSDTFEKNIFSADAAFENAVRRGVREAVKDNDKVIGLVLQAGQSQTVNIDNVVSRGIIEGASEYNEDMQKWQSVQKEENLKAQTAKLEEISKKYNLPLDEVKSVAHAYLVTKRLPGILERNAKFTAEIDAEQKTAKPDRKKIEELKALLVYVSPTQQAQMEPGQSLVKLIPELEQVSDIWQGMRKNTIKTMVDGGLHTKEYAEALLDNIDYVPYYRVEQLEEDAGPLEFLRGLQVKAKEHRLKGSDSPVNDVFDNQVRWMQYAMSRTMRAHKARQMIDVAKDIDIGGRKMAVKVTEQERGMNIVRIYRDGKQEMWDVADPNFIDAFAAIQNVSIPMFKWAAKAAEILRNTVVLYPLFSVAQVPQDSFAAMFTSGLKPQHALKIPYLAVQEFIKTIAKTSATHNELKKFGVVGARDFSADVMRKDAEIEAGLKQPKGVWGKTKEILEHVAMAGDNAVRQATYIASKQQGLSEKEALEKAFEIFNVRRRGTSKALNLAGQTIPFFYAYLAAQRVAYRTITGVGTSPTERKAALTTLAATSASVMVLSMIYAMMVGDDEDYAETPAAVRDRTLTIPGTGGVRIPLRPDFFLFPKIIAEHTYLMLTDKGYQDGAKFRTSMKDALVNATLSPTPIPQIVKPALEVAINYDFFQGKPLIGTFEKNKDLERQFRDTTSELAKLFGQTGMVSPIAVDHLIRGMLGSFGGLVLFGTNQFLHSDPDVPRPEMSANEMLAALPGTAGFLKRPQESALKNDFFVLRDAVEKAANTFNDIKTRSPEGIEAFLEDEKNAIRLGMAKGVDKINRHLSDIRRRMTIITNMPESQMPADEKAENIRELRELEREILRSVNVKELREMAKI
jgi:hypothetical protein